MTPENKNKKLTQWLLMATIALLALVLGLQLWQIFGGKSGGDNGSLTPDSANGPAASETTEPLDPPGVSHGKAAMIEDVQALNPALSFDDLAALSAQELEQLQETDAPGLPIGLSAAAQAAEVYAGTLAVDSVTSKTDPELDEAPAHYEVELRHPSLGDFEYKIDAYTGQVLEGLPDIMRSVQAAAPQETPEPPAAPETPAAPSAPQAPASNTQTPAPNAQTPARQPAVSGEEAAKSAAFTHAGVSADGVTISKCELDWEDGRQVYDIEFWADGIEYDYEIDASSCAVLKAGQDWGHHHHGGGSAAGQQPGAYIGEEAAKSAAFTHAGVSARSVSYVRCELDEDDGLWLYEIEFQAGTTEYEYEIDATTGAVLKAELDH